MTRKAYLRNGEEINIHERLENGEFIIERMYVYTDFEGNEYIEPCGKREVIDEVFDKPPIQKKNDDLINLSKKTKAKNDELKEIETKIILAKRELSKIEALKTDIQKHIINRSDILRANSITVFSHYKPYTLTESDEKRSLRITYSIDVIEGKLSAWGCTLDREGRSGMNMSINQKYGLLIDATEEEITEIGKQIVKDKEEISDWYLLRSDLLPDAYLTDDLKKKKEGINKKRET